jgi:hypothetical protein
VPGVFPGLVADPVVTAKDPKLHIGIVLHGLAGKAIDRKAYFEAGPVPWRVVD